MGRPSADCTLLAAEGAAAGMVYKPVVVRYDLYIPWRGIIGQALVSVLLVSTSPPTP